MYSISNGKNSISIYYTIAIGQRSLSEQRINIIFKYFYTKKTIDVRKNRS